MKAKAFLAQFVFAVLIYILPGHILAKATEQTTITFSKYEIHHQGVNLLDIVFTYHYKPSLKTEEYIDAEMLKKQIDSVLKNYPNTDDWWEIVNKKLTAFVIDKYSSIDSLASDITVNWKSGAGHDYGHYSPTRCLTCRTSAGKLHEYFGCSFNTKNCAGMNVLQGAEMLYEYASGIADTDYPDGLEVEHRFIDLIRGNYGYKAPWEKVNQLTAEAIFKQYKDIISIDCSIMASENMLNESPVVYRLMIRR